MVEFWSFLAFVAVLFALPPARWGARIWIATALFAVVPLMLRPSVQYWDQGWAEDVAGALTAMFLGAALLGVLLRWGVSSTLSRPPRRMPPTSAFPNRWLRLADMALAVFAGLCGGPLLVLILALALRGTPGGLVVHIAVFVLAAVAAGIVAYRARGLVRAAGVAGLLVVACMALAGGLYLPDMIERRAADASQGSSWCLRADDHAAKRSETMLLTLPRGRPGAPGLMLTVNFPEGPKHYRWSYRGNDFVQFYGSRNAACPA